MTPPGRSKRLSLIITSGIQYPPAGFYVFQELRSHIVHVRVYRAGNEFPCVIVVIFYGFIHRSGTSRKSRDSPAIFSFSDLGNLTLLFISQKHTIKLLYYTLSSPLFHS